MKMKRKAFYSRTLNTHHPHKSLMFQIKKHKIMSSLLLFACFQSAVICDTCITLDQLVADQKGKMPADESERYVAPSAQAMSDWETVVSGMMGGACVGPLPASLSGYELEVFADADNSEQYCVLAAVTDANDDGTMDTPWGTVIIYQDVSAKDISIDVPHPLHDSNTAAQGIAVFKGVGARSFVLSGSHRHANAAESDCDDGYLTADAAHTLNTFQSSITAIMGHYDAVGEVHTAIQFHGMGSDSCPGVEAHITHGSNVAPQAGEAIDLLRNALEAAVPGDHDFTVPGDSPSCTMSGTSNMQGRLLNGVAAESVCTVSASGYTARFIHIEQKSFLRHADHHAYWITALNNVDFSTATPPTGITVLSPNGGEVIGLATTVEVTWNSAGVTGDIKLSVHENNEAKTYVKTIENTAPNTGSYMWEVSGSTDEGSNFVVRARSVDETSIKDYSDAVFTIVNPIQVVAPNGGETLHEGDEVNVQWTAPGVGAVKLSLHKGTSFYKTIATETANDGTFLWTIPDVSERDDYRIRVRSVDETSVKAYSTDEFTIEP